jgi:hypothetical protein
MAAVVVFGMAPLTAKAVIVQYSTTGVFSNPTGAGVSIQNSGTELKITQGTKSVKVDFAGVLLSPLLSTPFTGAILGTFSETLVGPLAAVTGDLADFTLKIHQTLPGGGSDVTTGGDVTLTGKLTTVSSPGHFNIVFVPSSLTVSSSPSVTYDLSNYLNGLNQLELTSNPKLLQADISAATVPTPASVWGGMGLLGLVGAMKLSRKQFAV